MRILRKIITYGICCYFIYVLISGFLIFLIHEPHVHKNEFDYISKQLNVTKDTGHSNDRVVLLDDHMNAGIARIDFIQQAQETIDVAYFTLHEGTVANIFLGLLIDAADRGVQVNILLDGIFHNLRGELKDVIYSFSDHPNIELKLYEPLHLLKPWTWNNRLHDKLIVIDDTYAIIGGRNIGNKYFLKDEKREDVVNDRDVLIMNKHLSNQSVIYEMKDYLRELWNHDFSKQPLEKLSNRQQVKGEAKTEELLKQLANVKMSQGLYFNHGIDWEDRSISVDQILFLHNPIQRLNKEPWIWLEINHLIRTAHHSVVIESPYIIPTNKMLKYIPDELSLSLDNVTFMTNSINSSPNPLAFSGYLKHVDKMTEKGFNLREYVGPYSIHGKTYLFDHHISVIGSFNLDSRSTFLSTESMVIIQSHEFANQLYQSMESQMEQNSNQLGQESSLFFKELFLKALSNITVFFQHLL